MYKLDKIGGGLVSEDTGVLIKPTSKKFEDAFVQYLIRGISDGRTLSSLLPTDAPFLPVYPEVVDLIDSNKYKEIFAKAEAVRQRRNTEDSIELSQRAKQAPTKDNIDLAKIFRGIAADDAKKNKAADPLTIEFPRFLPDGFWGEDAEFAITAEPEYNYKTKKRIK